MPAHMHTLACLDGGCRRPSRKIKSRWPDPPPALIDLFRQTSSGAFKDTLRPIQRFIAKLPLKDASDNVKAAEYYRKIAIRHVKQGRRMLADVFYEIANQLWD